MLIVHHPSRRVHHFFLILLPFLLLGCRLEEFRSGSAAPPTPLTASPTAAVAPPTATAARPVPVATSPTGEVVPPTTAIAATPAPAAADPVPAACDPDEQAAAMRPDQVPDWSSLGLSACYDLAIQIDPVARRYEGTLNLTYTNRTPDRLSALLFRTYPNADVIYGGELEVTGATVAGEPVTGQVTLGDRTGYQLPLPSPLAPGESTRVTLHFEGAIPADFGGSESVYGTFNFDTASQTIMLANAFPILAAYELGRGFQMHEVLPEGDAVTSETALFRLTLVAPDEQQVITTGVEIARTRRADGTRHRIVTGPVRDLAIVLSPTFERTTVEAEGSNIISYYQPEAEFLGREAANLTAQAGRLFNQRFGPYPFAELDIVQVPLRNALGVEYPGLFVVEAETYTDPEQRTAFEVATVHEAAHQWWYSVVGNDVSEAPWQDEALVTWSSLYFFQEERPRFAEGLQASWERTLARYRKDNPDEPIAQPLSAFAGRDEPYGLIVYLKGALFFDALRDELGDEAFFQALQAYYRDHRYELAAPEDLLQTFERVSGRNLSEFYERWGVQF